MKTKMVSVRLPEGLARKVKVYAAAHGASIQQLIEVALVRHMKLHPITNVTDVTDVTAKTPSRKEVK